jgi:hypothetical protein
LKKKPAAMQKFKKYKCTKIHISCTPSLICFPYKEKGNKKG